MKGQFPEHQSPAVPEFFIQHLAVPPNVFMFVVPAFSVTSLGAQMIKHLPTVWETRVQSLGQEDLLEKERATHSNILVWKIPWTEEPGRLQSMGSQRVRHE